jgi:hypothetical protein
MVVLTLASAIFVFVNPAFVVNGRKDKDEPYEQLHFVLIACARFGQLFSLLAMTMLFYWLYNELRTNFVPIGLENADNALFGGPRQISQQTMQSNPVYNDGGFKPFQGEGRKINKGQQLPTNQAFLDRIDPQK